MKEDRSLKSNNLYNQDPYNYVEYYNYYNNYFSGSTEPSTITDNSEKADE